MRSAISSPPWAQMPGNPGWLKSFAEMVVRSCGCLVSLWNSWLHIR